MARMYRRNELAQELFKKNPQLVGKINDDEIVDSAIKKNPDLANRIVYDKKELAETLYKKNPQAVGKLDENAIIDMALKSNPNLQNRIIEPKTFDMKRKFTDFGEKLKKLTGQAPEQKLPDITKGPVISAERTPGLRERVAELFTPLKSEADLKKLTEKPEFVKRFFEAPPEKKIARAQVATEISKESGIPLVEAEKDVRDLAREKAKSLGIATQPKTEQIVGVATAPLIATGLATAVVPTVTSLGTFALLDKLIPIEKFIPTDASDTVKSAIEVADFVGKGMLAGGLGIGRSAITKKIKGTRAYKNLIAKARSGKFKKMNTAEIIETYKTSGREIKRQLAETDPRIREWLHRENRKAAGIAGLIEYKPKGVPVKQQPAVKPEPIVASPVARTKKPDVLAVAKEKMGIVEPKTKDVKLEVSSKIVEKLPEVSKKLIKDVRETSTGSEGFALNPIPEKRSKMTQEGAGGGKESVKAWQDINKNIAEHVRNDYKDVVDSAKTKSAKHKINTALFDTAHILWGKGKMPSTAYAKYRTAGSRQLALYDEFKRGFFDILNQLKNKKELKLGQAIYLNKFYQQSAKIGKKTSDVSEQDALRSMEVLKSENPQMYERVEAIMDQLAEYTNTRGLGILNEFNIVPKELLISWQQRMPNYISARAMDASLDHAFGIEGGDATSRLSGGFLKLRKGHDYEIETDLLKNIMNSVREKIVYSTNIDTLREVVKNPDWAVEIGRLVPTKGKMDLNIHPALPLQDLEIREFSGGNKLKRVMYKGLQKPADFINLATAIDGKIYAVDPDVYSLIQIGDKNTLGVVENLFKGFNRPFQMSATALRVAFGLVTNPQRDLFTMLLNVRSKEGGGSDIKMTPGRYARAIWESARASMGVPTEVAKKAINNGILRASLIHSPKSPKVPFKFLTVGQQAARIAKAPITIPWKILSASVETFENAPKFAEFKRLEDAGYKDTLSAITMARRVNADFDVHGGKTQTLRNLLVFFNPMLQGFNILFQTIGAQPKTSVRRIFTYGVLPSIMLYLWNRKQPGEDLIDDWIKDNYYYLNTGIMYKNSYGNIVPVVIVWSKSEWQKLLNPVTWMAEGFDKTPEGKSEFDSLGKKMYDNVMQWATGFVPPIIRSAVEVNIGDSGYSFYTRSPIVPPGREKLEPRLRFRPSDSIAFRKIAEIINVSPAKLTTFARSNLPAIAQLEEILNYVLRNKIKLPPGLKKEGVIEKIARLIPVVKIPSGFKIAQDVEKGIKLIKQEKETEAMEFLLLLREAISTENPQQAKEWMQRALEAAQKVPVKRRRRIVGQIQKQAQRRQQTIEFGRLTRESPETQAEFFRRFPKTAEKVLRSQKRKMEIPESNLLTATKRRLGINP